jgi:hypothetical protein
MSGKYIFLLTLFIFATSGFAQKRFSEREADGLKSNVKVVSTESARLKGESEKWVEETRQMESVVTYDNDGNRVKQDLYDYRGNLFQLSTYLVIDGDRAVKQEMKRYDYDPPPVALGSKADSKPRDPRFSYKFKYKYDDKGRRTEQAWYSNDGSLWLRYVSVYDEKGNEIEWFRYSADGSLNGRSTATYDSNGNETEKTWFRADGSLSEKWEYDYELDAKKNWIKRSSKKWVTRGGKSFFEPYKNTYRQITYF